MLEVVRPVAVCTTWEFTPPNLAKSTRAIATPAVSQCREFHLQELAHTAWAGGYGLQRT